MDDVEKKSWARADANGDFICIETFSGFRRAAMDPKGTQHIFPPDASDDSLGLALLDSLSHSRFISLEEAKRFFDFKLVHDRYEEWVRKFVQRYGYKSRRSLFKNMKSCGIECKAGQIVIRPSNHDRLEGWSGDGINKEDYVTISADSWPEQIGTALRLAFTRCK